jgi:hypothetical protein
MFTKAFVLFGAFWSCLASSFQNVLNRANKKLKRKSTGISKIEKFPAVLESVEKIAPKIT